jgi:hypothetical protein
MQTILFPPIRRERISVSPKDTRYVLAFPTSQLSVRRPAESDDLVLDLDGDRIIELTGFYAAFDADSLPEFETREQVVAGADFLHIFGGDGEVCGGPAPWAAVPMRRRKLAHAVVAFA